MLFSPRIDLNVTLYTKIILYLGTKGAQREGSQTRQMRDRGVQPQLDNSTMTGTNSATGPKTVTASVGTENSVGSQVSNLHLLNT